jgi:hypothetical protein
MWQGRTSRLFNQSCDLFVANAKYNLQEIPLSPSQTPVDTQHTDVLMSVTSWSLAPLEDTDQHTRNSAGRTYENVIPMSVGRLYRGSLVCPPQNSPSVLVGIYELSSLCNRVRKY